MRKLKSHLIYELKKKKPNQHLVKKLNKFIEKGSMTLEEWRDTGVFITDMHEDYPDKLHKDTIQVVMYLGRFFIEIKKPCTYFIKGFESQVLDKVEDRLWEKKVANYLHKS